MKTKWSFRLAAVLGVSVASAQGADIKVFTWSPGESGFSWKNSGNWDGPSGLHPDDYYDQANFVAAAANPELNGNLQGNVGGGLGQLVFQTAGWTVNNTAGDDYTMYFNSLTYFGYNAIFSYGSGINAINTKIQFVDARQNVHTASGNTLAIGRGFTGSYGPIISSVNPTANDTGAVRLDVASTASGAFYVRQGTLLVRHNDALGGSSATVNLGGDEYVADNANARLLTDASGVTIAKNIAVRTYSGHEVNATLGGNQTAGASTFSGTVTLNRGANLTSANTDGNAVSFNNTISGVGGITKVGVGTVLLNHANDYQGATTVNAGKLKLGTSGALPAGTDVTLANVAGAVLDLNGFSATIDSLDGGGGAGGNVTLGAATLTANSGNYAGVISGAGGLTKSGAGTLTLSGANLYGGLTTVSAGTLAYGANNVLAGGSVAVNGGSAVLSLGAYSDTVGAVTLDGGGQITGSGVLTSTSGFELRNGAANAPLGGAVGLTKTTAGTATLGAANTFSGETRISQGTLSLNHSLALQNSTLNLDAADAGTLNLNNLNVTLGGLSGSRALAIPDARTLSVGNNGAPTTYSGELSGWGASLIKVGAGTLTLSGNNSYSGVTTISAGTLQLGTGGTAGWLDTSIEDNAMLQFNRADGVVFTRNITGTGSLTKLGLGTLTLTGENSYGGGTLVRSGTLLVAGNHTGGGQYQVGAAATGGGGLGGDKASATLGGGGTIGGSVLALATGVLSPGTSIGTLTVQGDVTLQGTLKIELDGTGGGVADVVNVGGQFDLSAGTVTFDVLSALDDPVYVFASYGSLLGDRFLKEENVPPGYHIDYNYLGMNQIALVPEPAAASAFLLGLAGWMALTRRTRPSVET